MMLSATATFRLLVLFHVIATYGALMAGLIMTIRQFVSVVCNAAWFGNITSRQALGLRPLVYGSRWITDMTSQLKRKSF
jgi:hypothetical protein